jgi:hypothetical protein
VPFGTEVRMESEDGTVDALIAVLDQSGKPVKASGFASEAERIRVSNILKAHGIEVFDLVDGKLLIQGKVTEPFDITFYLNVYTPNATDGSPTNARVEEVTLSFLPMEEEEVAPQDTEDQPFRKGSGGCDTGVSLPVLGVLLAAACFLRRKKSAV